MTKPDLIEVWPAHIDYPLHRQFIHDNRDRFAKVIIIFTNMNTGIDYRVWLQDQFNKDGIISISNDLVESHQDWRDVAVNKGLTLSNAEWVWFTEEDFFPQEGFWDCVETLSSSTPVVGFFQEDRLHPCCIFIKRNLLNTTSRNFGVKKDTYDHFGTLQRELEHKNTQIGIISSFYGYHLNGLSQNMWMLMNGQEPNYEPEKFREYCRKCLSIELPIEPNTKTLLENYVIKEIN